MRNTPGASRAFFHYRITPSIPQFPPLALSKLVYKYGMNNKPDLPEGWAMPDDMAKRISELVNKKPYAPEDDLQDALDDMARDIALIEPDASDWGWWVTYLLEKMEVEAEKRGSQAYFDHMLKSQKKDVGN
jgi:hypothetical protein